MTIVKELNELAKKMTGTNPKARTDAQALDYIEQNFNGGGEIVDFVFDLNFITRYFGDPTKYGTQIEITNEDDIAGFEKIENAINENKYANIKIIFDADGGVYWTYTPIIGLIGNNDLFYSLEVDIPDMANNRTYSAFINKYEGKYYIIPKLYTLTPVS